MANPIIPGIPQTEQDLLYSKLNAYNQGRASYKEVGAYLIVLPRPEYLQYTLWIYSPLPGRQSIFYICDLSTDIHETLRMASTLCFYSPRSLLLVEYNAKRMQSKGDDIISIGKYHGHFLHEILRIDPAYLTWIAFKFQPRIHRQEICQTPSQASPKRDSLQRLVPKDIDGNQQNNQLQQDMPVYSVMRAYQKSGHTSVIHSSIIRISINRTSIFYIYYHCSPPFNSSLIHSVVNNNP